MELRELLLVAGPPCSGKSTFILQLRRGRLETVAEALGIIDPGQWTVGYAKKWKEILPEASELLILHYDFLRFWKRPETDAGGYVNDPALRSLGLFERSVVVTLWAEPAALIRRVRRRRSRLLRRSLRGNFREVIRGERISRKLVRLYSRPDQLRQHYDSWFAFCARAGVDEQWIADTTESVALLRSMTDWQRAGGRGRR